MEYVEAFVTLIVVFVIPAAIVIGLVSSPDRSRRQVTRSSAPPAHPPADHSV